MQDFFHLTALLPLFLRSNMISCSSSGMLLMAAGPDQKFKYNVLLYGFTLARFYVQEVQRDTSPNPPLKDQMSKRDPLYRDAAPAISSAATARSSRGHDHTRVPSSLLFVELVPIEVCVVFFGWKKRQPVKETNQSRVNDVEREHCLFLFTVT